jgi:hypothetical protein
MKDQNKQDEYERTFNLSREKEQNKMISLDHVLFQIEQFKLKLPGSNGMLDYSRALLNELKQYLKEQNNA